jgi:DNA-binding transcriptional ArsR family regulator
MAGATLAETAEVFAAIGDTTRLHIVTRLSNGGGLSIVRLTEDTNVSRQAVTKHLRSLESAGLVRSGRVGRERIWRLKPARLTEAQLYLDRISAQWDAALNRLRAFAEEE